MSLLVSYLMFAPCPGLHVCPPPAPQMYWEEHVKLELCLKAHCDPEVGDITASNSETDHVGDLMRVTSKI